LRGNQPKLLYHYLELRKIGNEKIREFLNYFPEHTNKFLEFREKVHAYTNTLYNMYVGIYILKKEIEIQSGQKLSTLKLLYLLYQKDLK
jgi:hypothetical protein